MGASLNRKRSASAGMWSSLVRSLIPSATGCSSPCHPTRIGPIRCCMCPAILRSNQVSGKDAGSRTAIRNATSEDDQAKRRMASSLICGHLFNGLEARVRTLAPAVH